MNVDRNQQIEEQLKSLAARRHVLEKRTQLRMATLAEFDLVRRDSVQRVREAIRKQNEDALRRNRAILEETNNYRLKTRNVEVVDDLLKAKEMYRKHAESALPQWHLSQTVAIEQKIKEIKAEKLASLQRKERLKQELIREERMKFALEEQRRDLLLSLATEQRELLEIKASSILKSEEAKIADRALFEHVQNTRYQLQNIMEHNIGNIMTANAIASAEARPAIGGLRFASSTAAPAVAPAAAPVLDYNSTGNSFGFGLPSERQQQQQLQSISAKVHFPDDGSADADADAAAVGGPQTTTVFSRAQSYGASSEQLSLPAQAAITVPKNDSKGLSTGSRADLSPLGLDAGITSSHESAAAAALPLNSYLARSDSRSSITVGSTPNSLGYSYSQSGKGPPSASLESLPRIESTAGIGSTGDGYSASAQQTTTRSTSDKGLRSGGIASLNSMDLPESNRHGPTEGTAVSGASPVGNANVGRSKSSSMKSSPAGYADSDRSMVEIPTMIRGEEQAEDEFEQTRHPGIINTTTNIESIGKLGIGNAAGATTDPVRSRGGTKSDDEFDLGIIDSGGGAAAAVVSDKKESRQSTKLQPSPRHLPSSGIVSNDNNSIDIVGNHVHASDTDASEEGEFDTQPELLSPAVDFFSTARRESSLSSSQKDAAKMSSSMKTGGIGQLASETVVPTALAGDGDRYVSRDEQGSVGAGESLTGGSTVHTPLGQHSSPLITNTTEQIDLLTQPLKTYQCATLLRDRLAPIIEQKVRDPLSGISVHNSYKVGGQSASSWLGSAAALETAKLLRTLISPTGSGSGTASAAAGAAGPTGAAAAEFDPLEESMASVAEVRIQDSVDADISSFDVGTVGYAVLAIVRCRAPLLIPMEAFTGVVTVEKLRKEYKKRAAAQFRGVSELWDAMTKHLQQLVGASSASLNYLSLCFTNALTAHVAADDRERIQRKVSKLLQIAMIPSEGDSRPASAETRPSSRGSGISGSSFPSSPAPSIASPTASSSIIAGAATTIATTTTTAGAGAVPAGGRPSTAPPSQQQQQQHAFSSASPLVGIPSKYGGGGLGVGAAGGGAGSRPGSAGTLGASLGSAASSGPGAGAGRYGRYMGAGGTDIGGGDNDLGDDGLPPFTPNVRTSISTLKTSSTATGVQDLPSFGGVSGASPLANGAEGSRSYTRADSSNNTKNNNNNNYGSSSSGLYAGGGAGDEFGEDEFGAGDIGVVTRGAGYGGVNTSGFSYSSAPAPAPSPPKKPGFSYGTLMAPGDHPPAEFDDDEIAEDEEIEQPPALRDLDEFEF